jgi:hypothetical protein
LARVLREILDDPVTVPQRPRVKTAADRNAGRLDWPSDRAAPAFASSRPEETPMKLDEEEIRRRIDQLAAAARAADLDGAQPLERGAELGRRSVLHGRAAELEIRGQQSLDFVALLRADRAQVLEGEGLSICGAHGVLLFRFLLS